MSGRYEKITDEVLADFQQKADEMKAKVLAAVDPEPGAFPGKCTSFLRRIERLGKLGVLGRLRVLGRLGVLFFLIKKVNCKIKCTFVNFEERQSAFSLTKVFSWIIMASFCAFTITKGL